MEVLTVHTLYIDFKFELVAIYRLFNESVPT